MTARSTPRSCWSARTESSHRCDARPSHSRDRGGRFAGLSRLVVPRLRFSQKTVHDARVVEFNRDQGGFARAGYVIYLRPCQADPLRRRRLSDPMVPLGAPVQHAGLHVQPRRGRAEARGARAWNRIPNRDLRRDQPSRRAEPDHSRSQAPRRALAHRHRRGAVEPVSARFRPGAGVSGRGPAGLHRRIPRLGLHRDAAGNADRDAGGAGDGRFPVRRRSGGAPARRGPSRRLARDLEAALQFHGPIALASPANNETPIACASRISDGISGSIAIQPETWNPPMQTCTPAARN